MFAQKRRGLGRQIIQQKIYAYRFDASQFVTVKSHQCFVIQDRVGLLKLHMTVGHWQILHGRVIDRIFRPLQAATPAKDMAEID